MTIRVGDTIPNVRVHVLGESGPETRQTGEIFSGKRAVMFALPGAFTPTCSRSHLPGYVEHAQEIRSDRKSVV